MQALILLFTVNAVAQDLPSTAANGTTLRVNAALEGLVTSTAPTTTVSLTSGSSSASQNEDNLKSLIPAVVCPIFAATIIGAVCLRIYTLRRRRTEEQKALHPELPHSIQQLPAPKELEAAHREEKFGETGFGEDAGPSRIAAEDNAFDPLWWSQDTASSRPEGLWAWASEQENYTGPRPLAASSEVFKDLEPGQGGLRRRHLPPPWRCTRRGGGWCLVLHQASRR